MTNKICKFCKLYKTQDCGWKDRATADSSCSFWEEKIIKKDISLYTCDLCGRTYFTWKGSPDDHLPPEGWECGTISIANTKNDILCCPICFQKINIWGTIHPPSYSSWDYYAKKILERESKGWN